MQRIPHRRSRWALRAAPALLVAVLFVTGVLAAVLVRQDVTVNPSAQAPDVIFALGTDYAAITAAGYATLTLGTSLTSATLALNGIPGAALVELTNVLTITNTDALTAYTVTLERSAAPDADITGLLVTVALPAGAVVATYEAVDDVATPASFTLPVLTSYDIDIAITIADGTTAPSTLGTFDLQFSLVPV